MESILTPSWKDYSKPYKIFGPLMTLNSVRSKIDRDGYAYYKPKDASTLQKLVNYSYEFLSAPHVNLGRDGDVCPFVGHALEKHTLRLTLTECQTAIEARDAISEMIAIFEDMPISGSQSCPVTGNDHIYKSILIGFPRVSRNEAPFTIDALQAELKTQFISKGMMIGQFHPACPEPGLRNPNFRPLQAPVPMLVIRYLTKYDLPFMTSKYDHLESFANVMGEEGRRRIDALLKKTFQ